MSVDSDVRVKIFSKDFGGSDGVMGEEIVPTGEIAVLKAYSSQSSGNTDMIAECILKFYTNVTATGAGDKVVTGDLMFQHRVERSGQDSEDLTPISDGGWGQRSPQVLIDIPGLGVLFENGMHIDMDVEVDPSWTPSSVSADNQFMATIYYQ